MNLLIKSAVVLNPGSSYYGKKADLLIERGIITEIKQNIKTDKHVKQVEGEELYVSAGWLDMQANFRDPGFEHKEDLQSGSAAAAQGGFTGVCVMPGTQPPLHSKSQIDYVVNKTKDFLVDVYPVGTISHQLEGKDLAEMYDMKLSGAVAFSDDKKSIKDAGLLMRALQYSSNIDSFIITHCDEHSLSHRGMMNEGEMSTRLGLKGIPDLAEELMVQRNIAILEYTGGKIHFPTISTKGSVELIKQAKAKGLQVTAGVAAHNLVLDESALFDFDTHYKVSPPLRSKEDVEALRKAVVNGVVDVIVSDHSPEDIESKDIEFDYAANGMSSIELVYGMLTTHFSRLSPETLVEKLAINPRNILGLPVPQIKEDELANLTVFDAGRKWVVNEKQLLSKSKNTPFKSQTFNGKVLAVINNKQVRYCV